MAAIGMRHLVGAPWAPAEQQTEGVLPKYGAGLKIGRAISANITSAEMTPTCTRTTCWRSPTTPSPAATST